MQRKKTPLLRGLPLERQSSCSTRSSHWSVLAVENRLQIERPGLDAAHIELAVCGHTEAEALLVARDGFRAQIEAAASAEARTIHHDPAAVRRLARSVIPCDSHGIAVPLRLLPFVQCGQFGGGALA